MFTSLSLRIAVTTILSVVSAAAVTAQGDRAPILELRVYTLKPGVRDAFHAQFVRDSLPMLQRARIDVVAFGPSLHDRDSYYLLRTFGSIEQRDRAEVSFYDSPEWREGPRDTVLAAIQTYSTAVVHVDHAILKGLRTMSTSAATPGSADDVTTLVRLNDDYIQSVRASDAKRFDEILAADFLCTQADGTLIDRAEFLTQAAKPTTAHGLQVHDVNVRLLGDTAIVHAATTFTHPDGRPGRGRYTDIWAKRDGRWVAVAAQFSRQ